MKRALVLLVATLTACGGGKIDATEARNALPTSASVKIATPDQSTTSQALTADTTASALTAQSSAYRLTRDVTGTVNLGVGLWIGLLEFVVALPPTSCAADTCTWGPWAETNLLKPAASYRLTVTKEGESQYSYKFSAAAGTSSAFVDIIAGTVSPNGVPHHGAGSFTVDFDAARTVNPGGTDTGKLVVNHDNVAGLKISETLTGGTDQQGDRKGDQVNAVYAFDQNASGGDLQVGLHYAAGVRPETTFTLHSRWNSTGAGRADSTYKAPTAAEASECWGARTDVPAFDLDPACVAFPTAAPATVIIP